MVLCAKICVCLGQKFGEGVMGRGQKIDIFSHGTLPAMCHSKQIGHCDGTGQAIGTHTVQADNAHCADEIETGTDADGPVYDTGTHTTH